MELAQISTDPKRNEQWPTLATIYILFHRPQTADFSRPQTPGNTKHLVFFYLIGRRPQTPEDIPGAADLGPVHQAASCK